MANWTKDNIPNLDGKVFVVTGANSGIGYESSLALAEKSATVVMACRNSEKAQRAMEQIKAAVPAAKVEVIELDLASLKSVREFADTFKKNTTNWLCWSTTADRSSQNRASPKMDSNLISASVTLGTLR